MNFNGLWKFCVDKVSMMQSWITLLNNMIPSYDTIKSLVIQVSKEIFLLF